MVQQREMMIFQRTLRDLMEHRLRSRGGSDEEQAVCFSFAECA